MQNKQENFKVYHNKNQKKHLIFSKEINLNTFQKNFKEKDLFKY